MKRRARTSHFVAEINITPFTDVILVLLIIFMVSTPLIFRSSIQVQLPEATALLDPPKNIAVTVNSAGEVFLEGVKYNVRYDQEVLKFKLAALVKNAADSSITIDGDRDVKYGVVVRVMDAASLAGIRHIVLGTELKR